MKYKKLVEDWAKAIRAATMEGILADHTPDVVMFDVPVPLQSVGVEAYKKEGEVVHRSRTSFHSFQLEKEGRKPINMKSI